jgi:hypothetical protein
MWEIIIGNVVKHYFRKLVNNFELQRSNIPLRLSEQSLTSSGLPLRSVSHSHLFQESRSILCGNIMEAGSSKPSSHLKAPTFIGGLVHGVGFQFCDFILCSVRLAKA